MDLEMLKTILRTIFIEWQAFGFILGVGVPLLLYKLTKKDSAETLESSRKKEFDKNQIEEIIAIFRSILSVLYTNADPNNVNKNSIPQDLLSKFKIEVQLVGCFDEKLREKINKNIYKECLYYNEIGVIKYSKNFSQTESSDVENEKRKVIEKNIIEVVDEIKNIYSKS